jgi:hypothetical protein
VPGAGPAGLAVAALMAWRLWFCPSEQARAWRRGTGGERQTARLLDDLHRDGYQVFHDLAMPGSPADVDHLADGLIWYNHYRLDRTLPPCAGRP